MSYAVTINIEVESVEQSIVKEVMEELGWDGNIIDTIGSTVYYEGAGNICMGTSEMKQEKFIEDAFSKKIGKEVDISIFWS